MTKIYHTNEMKETISIGKKIGQLLKPHDVILLVGDLSAGKTTITKGIAEGLGVKKTVNSPTFTIVKEYQGRCPLYHLDLYRLNGLNQDYDLEEYIESDGVCVIEWPYQIEEILPQEFLKIEIIIQTETKREIKISANGMRYEEVVERL